VVTVSTATMMAVLVADGALGGARAGLPDAGALVRWAVPVGHVLQDVSAIVAVGSLLVAAVLLPAGPDGASLARLVSAARRSAAAWSAAWTVLAVSLSAVTVSQITGIPLQRLSATETARLAWSLPPTRALLLSAGLAVVTAGLSHFARSRRGAVLALVVAVLALTPPLYAGHSAHAGEHQVATGSLVVHVVAATLWIGGLVGLTLLVRRDEPALAPAVSRFSTLALVCFCALVATGLLAAFARLGLSRDGWVSPYGAVLALKVLAAVSLGSAGWAHRRWTLDRLRSGRPGAYARLAGAEVVVMAATVGIAVALSRTPSRAGTGLLDPARPSAGPGLSAPAVSLHDLVVLWRPEPVLTTLALVALATQLTAVRRVVRRGHRWPAARTACGGAAVLAAILALGLPTGPLSRPWFAVQTGQFLALAVVVPALAALSGPSALLRLLRPSSASPVTAPAGAEPPAVWRQSLSDPTTGFIVFVAATIAVLQSPLRSAATSSPPAHVLSLAIPVIAGALFCWSVIGLDSAADVRPARERAAVLGVAWLFLLGLAIVLALRSSGTVDDDRLGAAKVLGTFAVTLGPLACLAVRSQNRRERVAAADPSS
jgi:putative copper export protein/cytochrome c oxidase assembly factor CtaG